MKQRTKLLPLAQLMMLLMIVGCKHKPETPLLSDELNKCKNPDGTDTEECKTTMVSPQGQVVRSSGLNMNHMLLYYFLFSGNRSYSGITTSRFKAYDGKDQGRYSGTYAGSRAAAFTGSRGSIGSAGGGRSFSVSRATISRGGFGSTARGFSIGA